MNLWGYYRNEPGDEDGQLRELREVSVVAGDPADIRRVAQFLAAEANIVEGRLVSILGPTAVRHLIGTFITGVGPMNRATRL